MEHSKFTTIAHSDHVFCSPLTSPKVDQILGLLDLSPGERVLDVGCGKAEVLVCLIERFYVKGVGVDTNRHFLSEARSKAVERVSPADLVLHEVDIGNLDASAESFDAAMCMAPRTPMVDTAVPCGR